MRLFSKSNWGNHRLSNLAFALGAAVLIWAGVGARLTSRRTCSIPLEVSAPEGLAWKLQNYEDLEIDITLEGPAETLASLSKNLELDNFHFHARLELTASELGKKNLPGYVLQLNPSRDLEIPRRFLTRLRVVSCDPSFVQLDISPIVEREYRVAPIQEGVPPKGELVIDSLKVATERVTLRGSLDLLEAYENNPAHRDSNEVVVFTRPVNVQNASRSFNVFAPFVLPDGVTSTPSGTQVSVIFKARESAPDLRRSFELDLHFLLGPRANKAWLYELRPPRDRVTVTLEGSKKDLDNFAKALASRNPKRRPYALIRVPNKVEVGPQTGELELGNTNPGRLKIRGDNTVLYKVREAK